MKVVGNLTKEDLQTAAEEGHFIYDPDYPTCSDLDGANARRYLESRGFEVVRNYDCGNNGWALTSCGIVLSTNGFIHKPTEDVYTKILNGKAFKY